VINSSFDDTADPIAELPSAPARPLFWLALAALVVSIATVLAMTAYARGVQRWTEHSTRVYQTTRSGLLDLTGSLPRSDGAAATGRSHPERAIARFDSVGDLTSDNPIQQARMRDIRELTGEWANASRAGAGVAPGLAEAVEEKLREFLTEEQRLYRVRSDRFRRAQTATAFAVTLELTFVALIMIMYARRISRHVVAAYAQQQQLEEQAAEVEEQAMELEISNHELRSALEQVDAEHRSVAELRRQAAHTDALLQASLSSAPVGMALLDADLRYIRVNARWAELTGVADVEHVGRRLDEDLPFSRDALSATLQVISRARTQGAASLDVPISARPTTAAEGESRAWRVSASPVWLDGAAGVALSVADVTHQAHEVSQTRVAEQANPLPRDVAHDVNNNLAVIGAYASMLSMSRELSDGDRSRVREILDTVQRTARLTRLTAPRDSGSQPETLQLEPQASATLLIVEDDDQLRAGVVAMLEGAGYSVVEARSGEDALHRLEERGDTVDLVITDLVMPRLSGRELSEIVADRYPALRVLFTSAHADDGVVRRAMIERGYPFVQKPFTPDQLLDAIDQALTAA
jgi:PAS domain S-box-containing protein